MSARDPPKPSPSLGRERRQFPRVQAPLRCRALGAGAPSSRGKVATPVMQDISLGGVRIYSEAPVERGSRFELEVFLPDASSFTCKVEVVWVEELPAGAPARHDVGLQFLELRPGDRKRLEEVLGTP